MKETDPNKVVTYIKADIFDDDCVKYSYDEETITPDPFSKFESWLTDVASRTGHDYLLDDLKMMTPKAINACIKTGSMVMTNSGKEFEYGKWHGKELPHCYCIVVMFDLERLSRSM